MLLYIRPFVSVSHSLHFANHSVLIIFHLTRFDSIWSSPRMVILVWKKTGSTLHMHCWKQQFNQLWTAEMLQPFVAVHLLQRARLNAIKLRKLSSHHWTAYHFTNTVSTICRDIISEWLECGQWTHIKTWKERKWSRERKKWRERERVWVSKMSVRRNSCLIVLIQLDMNATTLIRYGRRFD